MCTLCVGQVEVVLNGVGTTGKRGSGSLLGVFVVGVTTRCAGTAA